LCLEPRKRDCLNEILDFAQASVGRVVTESDAEIKLPTCRAIAVGPAIRELCYPRSFG